MNRTISILMMLAAMLLGASAAFAENINIYNTGDEPLEIDCDQAPSQGGTSVFLYDDGGTGNYQTGQSYTMTLNANNGGYIAVYFEEFNLATGTLMSIRNEVTQEMLESNASGTTLRGNTFISINGSITLIFNSGSTAGAGFKARVYCGHACQRFATEINVEGVTPTVEVNQSNVTETFFDVCPGTQVQFHAVNNFFQNGNNGYTQTDANVTYDWAIINSTQDTNRLSGQNPTYTFNESGGYFVICTARDQQECYNRNSNKTKVRVSVRPTWTANFAPDSVCPGTIVSMSGEPHVETWEYEIPDILAGTTFLPDGDNTCYNTSLQFDIFEEGRSITSINDIDRIYLNMEHSWLGDLSIMIECPNGQNCLLKAKDNSTLTASFIGWTNTGGVNQSGSIGGSSIYLGLAHDGSSCNNDPGYGFPYYFYPDGNEAFGTNGTTVSVNRNDYADLLLCPGEVTYNSILAFGEEHRYGSYESMSSLVGCPLNGTWTIYVCDLWRIDNGYIFEWGLFFDESLYPSNLWQFSNSYAQNDYAWSGVGVQSGQNGSANATAAVQSPYDDDHTWAEVPYTFSATDNFGCTYDTTLVVHVKPSHHADCCITPIPTATASDLSPCTFTTTLVANEFASPGNTGEWTYTGPGTATFADVNAPETRVDVNIEGEYVFTWHEYYLGNQSCTGEASVNVNFARAYRATLEPIDNSCRSGDMIILEAPDFGTLTCTASTGADAGTALNADARTFTPSLVEIPGTFTITNTIPDDAAHRCANPRTSSQTFTIYDELTVSNRVETCVSSNDRLVRISFDVNGVANPNLPPSYSVTGGYTEYADNATTDQNPPHTIDNFSRTGLSDVTFILDNVHSALDYALVVTDANQCSNVNVTGLFQCDCPNYAGTFADYSAKILCTGVPYTIEHNDDFTIERADGGIFSYVVCTDPSDIPNTARYTVQGPFNHGEMQQNPTTIAPGDIQGFEYGRQYYLVAIAGYGLGVNAWGNFCRSVSQAVPLMWKQTPTPYVTPGDTCGLVMQLHGSEPPEGMYGYWSATAPEDDPNPAGYSYTTIEGTNNNSPNALVLANHYGLATYTWNVVNAECTGTASTQYNFRRVPQPVAGSDMTVCGVQALINGAYATNPTIENSTLQWTGAGVTFSPSNSIQPLVNANTSGTYQVTLTERNGVCAGSATLNITFVNVPAPVTTANVDTVCGNVAELQVYNTNPAMEGRWTAYDLNNNVLPTVSYRDYNNPDGPSDAGYTHCYVTVPIEGEVEVEYEFRWTEPIDDPRLPEGLSCDGQAIKRVVFRKVPVVNVSECGVPGNDRVTICGRSVELCASSISEDYANFSWVCKDIAGSFSNPTEYNTTFTLDSTVQISRSSDIDFYFIGANGNCMAIDTMHVHFIQKPVANAGLDHAACGLSYNLNGVWSMLPSADYTPVCQWTIGSTPNPDAQVIWETQPQDSIVERIQVSDYGVYTFIVTEINNWGDAAYCFDSDTVTVEFMERPSVYAGADFDVCGQDFQLHATSSHVEGDSIYGQWLASGANAFDDPSDPNTTGHYSSYGPATFTWVETNHPHIEVDDQETCAAQDQVVVTFYPQPSAVISMNPGDTAVCGLTYTFLRAQAPGDGVRGYWYEESPSTEFGPNNVTINSPTTEATVGSYGRHEYYWILYSGNPNNPSFCTDTAGPWHIDFIEQPSAQIAETEFTYCGYFGQLSQLNVANSVGNGRWSTNAHSSVVSFNDASDPNTLATTTVLNSENGADPYYTFYWNVSNTQYCTDKDSVRIVFAANPSGEFTVIPPKCFGEPAILTASDTTLQLYDWDYGSGSHIDDSVVNQHDGGYQIYVHWENGDTVHNVTLVTANEWQCRSAIGNLTIDEPPHLEYIPKVHGDVCGAGNGYVQFVDTTIHFYWLDSIGSHAVTALDSFRVSNLREGTYSYRTVYQTFNTTYRTQYLYYFGSEQCVDTLEVAVPLTGELTAEIDLRADIKDQVGNLVAPTDVTFIVDTGDDVDPDVEYVWMWDFGDGTPAKPTKPVRPTGNAEYSEVTHTYEEAGNYAPYLVIWVADNPKCRQTFELAFELPIDVESDIEIPNIFSPNGDGINDYFQVKAQTLNKFHGKILNRYGRVVYEWDDPDTETAGWDGKLNGSTKATPGVYYYIIEAVGKDGKPYEKQGALHLVKE